MRDVNQMTEESDHCMVKVRRLLRVASKERTKNFLQGGEGTSGKASRIEADLRKSMIADVVLDEFIED